MHHIEKTVLSLETAMTPEGKDHANYHVQQFE
jgi:hypothetical protein